MSAEGQAPKGGNNSSHRILFCHLKSVKITGSNPSTISGIHVVLEKFFMFFHLNYNKGERVSLW